jgi:hypothetical protein
MTWDVTLIITVLRMHPLKARLPIEVDDANMAGWIAGTTLGDAYLARLANEAASKTEYDFSVFSSFLCSFPQNAQVEDDKGH